MIPPFIISEFEIGMEREPVREERGLFKNVKQWMRDGRAA